MDPPRLLVSRHHPEAEDEISVLLDGGLDPQRWHHYCFVFSSYPELPAFPGGGGINLTNKAYMDGVFVTEGVCIKVLG